MKKLFLSAIAFFFCRLASAQVIIAMLFGEKLNSGRMEFGLMLSPTFSNITNITSEVKPGFGLSLYLIYKQSDNLFFRVEASPKAVFGAKNIPTYKTGNTTIDSIYKEGANVERKIKAITLPLLVRYRINGLLFAEGGPQVNLMTKAKDVFETRVDDNDLSYTTDIEDHLTKFDVGFTAGLEYKLKKDKGIGIGLRYYYGFVDIQKTTANAQHNSAWTINIAIPVGAGKKK
jgi:hypothetical protein